MKAVTVVARVRLYLHDDSTKFEAAQLVYKTLDAARIDVVETKTIREEFNVEQSEFSPDACSIHRAD